MCSIFNFNCKKNRRQQKRQQQCYIQKPYHVVEVRTVFSFEWLQNYLTISLKLLSVDRYIFDLTINDKFEMILPRGSLQNHSIFGQNKNWTIKFLSIGKMTINEFNLMHKYIQFWCPFKENSEWNKCHIFLLINFAESKEMLSIFFALIFIACC